MNSALRNNLFFEGVSDEDFKKLEALTQVKSFPKDSVLINEGMPGENLYLLIEGHARIVRMSKYGEEMILAIRNANDFFGEMALLDQAPRSARVITNDAVSVGVISKSAFNEIITHQPQVAINILRIVSARLRQTNDQLSEAMDAMEKIHATQIMRYQSLLEFSKVIAKEKDSIALFNALPALVQTQIDSDQSALFVEDGAEIVSYVRQGAQFERKAFPSLQKFIQLKKPLVIENLSDEKEWAALDGFVSAQSVLLAPIQYGSQKGLLAIFLNHPFRWTYEDQAFVATVTSYVSMMSKHA